jgi:hypothetical protein
VPTSADKSSELMKKYLRSRAAGAMRAFALQRTLAHTSEEPARS